MTNPSKGDRVRVTIEGVILDAFVDLLTVRVEGDCDSRQHVIVTNGATNVNVEVIETPFVLPTEVGSVVRVSYVDGGSNVAMLRSDGKWVDESGWVWKDPSILVDGAKVEVATFGTPEAAKPAEKLIDDDGDTWHLRENGKYTMSRDEDIRFSQTRDYIARCYGILEKD